ncbi:MAG: thioredoxin-disulfide reductase [Clostridiaceae bacterium]|nr:thioredoxin-disulfide reductase [Clostridiaceae bacterium]
MSEKIYDVIILGAGPAGLSAGIYAGRADLDTLIIEQALDGGQIAQTASIENYPGQIPEGESGTSLIERFTKQAELFGVERAQDSVQSVELESDIKVIKGMMGTYKARSVIIATGASPRKGGFKNEDNYIGGGVSYCATCDGNFFKNFDVYVVGGGEAAVEEAMHLAKLARNVTIIHRRDRLRAVESVQNRAKKVKNLHYMLDSVVEEIDGDGILEEIKVRNVKSNEITVITKNPDDKLMGLFVFVGFIPNTNLFEGQIDMENGYILTDEDMKTNIPGVFAAGDLRKKNFRQVITAASDGAIASNSVRNYLARLEGTEYI